MTLWTMCVLLMWGVRSANEIGLDETIFYFLLVQGFKSFFRAILMKKFVVMYYIYHAVFV